MKKNFTFTHNFNTEKIKAALGAMIVCKSSSHKHTFADRCSLGELIAACIDEEYALSNPIAQIRALKKEGKDAEAKAVKDTLPVAMFQCREFRQNQRKSENAVPGGLCVHDFDGLNFGCDPSRARVYYNEYLQAKVESCTQFTTLFFYITASGNGFGAVTVMRDGENCLAQEQKAYAEYLGLQNDESVKDLARCRYLPSAADIIFVNTAPPHFDPISKKRSDAIFKASIKPNAAKTMPKALICDGTATPLTPSTASTSEDGKLEINGIPADVLIEKVAEFKGVEWPAEQGSRHSSLLKIAPLLSRFCTTQEDFFQLLRTAEEPGFDAAEINNIAQCVLRNGELGLLYRYDAATKAPLWKVPHELSVSLRREMPLATPMPSNLPPFCQMVLKACPVNEKREALVAMLPILSTIGTGVRLRIKDSTGRREYATTTLVCLVGEPSSGKSSLKLALKNTLWKKYEEESDRLLKKAEEEKEERSNAADNQKKMKLGRYKIRGLGENTTLPALCQRLRNLDGDHGLILTDEVSALKITEGHKHDLTPFLKMFHEEDIEITRAHNASYKVKAMANLLGCSTHDVYRKWMGSLDRGLHTRIITVPISEKSLHCDIEMPEGLNPQELQEMSRLLDQLHQTQRCVDVNHVEEVIDKWQRQKKLMGAIIAPDFTQQTIYRIRIIAMRAAALMAAICTDSEQISNYALFVAEYVFNTQLRYWGRDFEELAAKREQGNKVAMTGWFCQYAHLLPPTFSMKEAQDIITQAVSAAGDTPRTPNAIRQAVRRYCTHIELGKYAVKTNACVA